MDEPKISIGHWQFSPSLNYSVFVQFSRSSFGAEMKSLLADNLLNEVTEKNSKVAITEIEQHVLRTPNARQLNLRLAGPQLAGQITAPLASDYYGSETVFLKDGHHIYRYKNFGLMNYAYSAKNWELGITDELLQPQHRWIFRAIMNRYLTWALVPFGIIGLWGVPVEEGIVTQKMQDTKGEVVFIDLLHQRTISMDGCKPMKSKFQIIRPDATLKGRNIRMGREELLGLLFQRCSFFDYNGPSTPVRQMLLRLSALATGVILPQESFLPRTDLSL